MNDLRVGLVVPSSNVTVETEMPRLLGKHLTASFSFHASRMRMARVSAEELAAMNAQRERCVAELSDAEPDVMLYACLVALMAVGPNEHRRVEGLIAEQMAAHGAKTTVRSSAGALVEGLQALNARRIALVTPYLQPLAQKVVGYLDAEGFDIADYRALEVESNKDVGCIPGENIMDAARSLNLTGVDALVISACVQMPSLPLIEPAEQEFGLPVISAATAGAFSILRAVGIPTDIAGSGSLLRTSGLA